MSDAAEMLTDTIGTAAAILVMTLLPLAGITAFVAGIVFLCRYFRRSK